MTIGPVFTFPGQGGYLPGLLGETAAGLPEVRDVLTSIDAVAAEYGHQAVSELLTDADAPSADTLLTADPGRWDLTLFAGSMAAYTVQRDVRGVVPSALLGHSMGEIAALTASGALTVDTGARVVCERAVALKALPPPDGGLVAVGACAERVVHLIEALAMPSLTLAAENGPRQSVVSGDEAGLAAVVAVATAAGWQVTRLRSPRIQHSFLLEPARQRFVAAIAALPVAAMRVPVYSPHHCAWYRPDETLLELMSQHLTRPVRFLDAVRHLHAYGADVFVECGAKRALTDLVLAAVPGITAEAPFATRRTDLGAADEPAATTPVSRPPEPAAAPATPPPAPEPPTVSAAPAGTPPAELESEIVELYATTLNYPADVFTADADLEADLGIDSLKQMNLMALLADKYQLPALPQGLRISEYTTVPAVAELVRKLAAGEVDRK